MKKPLRVIENIHAFIDEHSLLPDGKTVIVGLSGGPDSVFLLHLLAELRAAKKLTLIAAHLDHEWRADSADDAQFCAKIAENLDVPYVSKKMSELSGTFTGSKEEQGRKARRAFFEQLQKEYGASRIALAHHLQDQEETFFIRLIRGTTLTGLCSMWPQDGPYIRPLLETNKKDIIAWLNQNSISYLTDPTNISPDFLRNRIRHTVLTAFEQADSRFDQNFLLTLQRLQQTEDFLEQLTQSTLQEMSSFHEEKRKIDLSKLFALHPALYQRVIFAWLWQEKVSFVATQQFLDEVIRFLQSSESKTHAIHHAWKLVKQKNYAWVEHQ